MRIAVVVGSFPQLSETFILSHLIGLIKDGHQITIFATELNTISKYHTQVEKYDLLNKVVIRPNPHIGVGKRWLLISKLLWKNRKHLPKLLQTFLPRYYKSFALKGYFFFEAIPFLQFSPNHFDLIHAHFGENGNKISYLKEIGIIDSKLIVNFHGHDVNHKGLVRSQNNYKTLENEADGLIFNSQYLLSKYKQLTNTRIPCYQIPVGIDLSIFTPKKTKIHHTKVKFITVARLVDCKGIELVLEAMTHLDQCKFEYHILGDGPNRENIEQIIKINNLNQNVFMHGALTQNAVIRHLKQNDYFLLFGITDKNGEIDAQGLVVQEAQACGLPVIVSNGGGIPEGVRDNITGYIIEEGNIEMLRNKLNEIIKQESYPIQMSIAASKYAHDNYSQHHINKLILNTYKVVLNE
ncbi:glycosyltransferase [Saccharicrinis sp. GN24d3]|uniref:glycosyltransferase n=1 Tax=Saccharicrinis sp. GN24d3 TaxID=3458416 RepID=UPI004035763F